ncbi:hypothetical protein MTR67_000648 [Solanum verrucosum]|uniref:Uncharacterized protein n=1 Tax=Solanum verrucosum TaxID=315347 RepID=A0AAF0PLP9_SOLVR|nr:hypothetical protein MTR67_000644 [Solanum verrucosum]WMV07263.1 hypothetical protein MTR67_000648 [Solanum verrucosum]
MGKMGCRDSRCKNK